MPGFTITGELSSSATGSTWSVVRNLDGHPFALRIVPVADVTEAQQQATREMAMIVRIGNGHVVRQYRAIALAEGTLAMVLDEVSGGSLAQLVGGRGQLRPGETVTTVAPLFGALADLHEAGVVHGSLSPASVLFSADGRPMICDLGVAALTGRTTGAVDETLGAVEGPTGAVDGTSGFMAPETVGGAAPSAASDVYAMAALGWFCLMGAAPGSAARRPSLTSLRPDIPARLVDVLTSSLSTDPAQRPSARAAANEIFHAAPAESVALVSTSDPAAEITRRIRAAAVSAPAPAPPSAWERHRRSLAMGAAAILVAAALGGGATWFFGRTPGTAAPVAATRPTATASPAPTPSATTTGAASTTTLDSADVMTAADSPRVAAGRRGRTVAGVGRCASPGLRFAQLRTAGSGLCAWNSNGRG